MAWYSAGTISVTQNTNIVVGTSTQFVDNVKPGYAFVSTDGKLYEIADVDSQTQLTLVSNYIGTSVSNGTYNIIPTHGLTKKLTDDIQTLITDFTDIKDFAGNGLFERGSDVAPGISFRLDTNTGIYSPVDNEITIVANGVAGFSLNETDTSLLAGGVVKATTTSTGLTVSGTTTTDNLQFTGGTDTQGTMSWNADEETVDLIQDGTVLQIGQETHWHCRNNTGSPIPDGTPVMATGTLGSSGRITIAPMDGTSIANGKLFLGITTEAIANDADGKVTHFGKIRGLDTSAWNDGDVLYISTTTIGAFQNTEPTSGLNLPIAFVIHSHLSQGVLAVRVQNSDQNNTHKDHNETVTGSWTFDQALQLSGGVVFGTTGGAVTSKTLDDYEEGTFTPTLYGTTSGTGTFTAVRAQYTKIGRLVEINIYLSSINISTIVGSLRLGGLPFTSSTYSPITVSYCNAFNFDEATTSVSGFVPTSATYISFLKGSSVNAITDTDCSASGSGALILCATYEI